MSELKVHYEVEFAGKPLRPAPFTVSFQRERGLSTVCEVRSIYPTAIPMRDRPPLPEQGTPVEVRWGTKPSAMRTWYGYVHFSRPDYDHVEPGSEAVRYVLVSTGHALEVEKTRDWRRITDSGIAQQIAQEHNLSAVIHRTTRIYDYLLQDGISDLEWLRERGTECGRQVHVENGVLYYIDPASMAMAKKAQPLKLTMNKQRQAEAVVNVEPLYGTLVPQAGKQAKRALTGFDIDANRLINAKQVPQQPAPDFIARDTAVASPADLYQNVAALGVEHEEWLHARVEIVQFSNVDHIPGQLVDLQGEAVSPKMRGTWMITGSNHRLQSYLVAKLGNRLFDSELKLSRNSANSFVLRDRRMPGVDDSCVRAGGKWRSASQQVVIL
ncbi:hypothetical protein [Nonomuraea typhae]|uniref:Phage late control D family protein n=1 Tax=Nonomuraea typhae TaxID=2603600 RepID=A0ABW7YJ29_9ACTN